MKTEKQVRNALETMRERENSEYEEQREAENKIEILEWVLYE